MRTWCTLLVAMMLGFASCGANPPLNSPAQIIILRHAEKPEVGSELSPRGMERAKALATLFTQDQRVLEHGTTVAIFAMKPAKKDGSLRAIETMEPTARALKLKIDRHFTREEISGLVHKILTSHDYVGKTVVICWEHEVLPEMVKAFGWASGPSHWPEKTFDRLWILDFENGKPAHFRDLPEKVLSGDSEQ